MRAYEAAPNALVTRMEPRTHYLSERLVSMSESYHAPRRSRKTCNHAPAPSGIYEICHIVSGKVYIGSALCVRCRWLHHKRELNRNKHGNAYLQAAWNKYGEAAFSHRTVEECCIDMLIVREQYWLDTTHCTDAKLGFNISPTAQSQLGFHHSEQGCKNISRAKSNPSEHTRELLRLANLGKKRPEADCVKISKGSASRRLTQEQVIEIQERYEASNHLISQTQLAKEYGVANRTISSVVRREFPRYQTDVPFSGESTKKMNGIASLPPEQRKHTEEHNHKIGRGNTGKVFSEERKLNISKSLMGKPSHRKGQNLTEAHKQHIREAKLKRKEQTL